jgi:hypothetical protein
MPGTSIANIIVCRVFRVKEIRLRHLCFLAMFSTEQGRAGMVNHLLKMDETGSQRDARLQVLCAKGAFICRPKSATGTTYSLSLSAMARQGVFKTSSFR